MANINRTLGPPWNILCDHSDSMAQRDTGWIQFYVESNQEALDTIVHAYRIAEQVLLPVMVNLDGFFLSHTAEVVDLPEQSLVDEFLPPYQPRFKLDVDNPLTFGAMCLDSNFMCLRQELQQAMSDARRVAQEVDDEYGAVTGRRYGVVEPYRLDGAKTILVTAGTITSTSRVVVDRLRNEGEPVGLLKLRMVRPFPFEHVRALLGQAERVAVIDRSVSYGLCGGLAAEVRSALYDSVNGRPPVFGFIAGLGGQDVVPEDIEDIIRRACSLARPPQEDIWIGVRS
jgi:pyruvate ferredoxin oxidoreductase alpha subunit